MTAPIARTSPEWPTLKAWLRLRERQMLDELASPQCGIKEADLLRGRILFVREMLAEVEPASREVEEITVPAGSSY